MISEKQPYQLQLFKKKINGFQRFPSEKNYSLFFELLLPPGFDLIRVI